MQHEKRKKWQGLAILKNNGYLCALCKYFTVPRRASYYDDDELIAVCKHPLQWKCDGNEKEPFNDCWAFYPKRKWAELAGDVTIEQAEKACEDGPDDEN